MLYTEDHRNIMESIRRFVAAEIDPHVDEWEAAEIFPAHELFRKMGGLGFLGITKPVEYGGLGLDFSYAIAAAEALGYARAQGIGMGVGVQTDMATPALTAFGSDALKREFLAPAIAGEMVCSIGVSEAGAGSDVASLKTRARRDGDDYVISGSKMWITNGTQADWICLLCNTSDGPAHKNKSLIVVPLKQDGKRAKGVEVQKIRKFGMWCSDTAQIFFDEVRVPVRHRIGEEGMGFIYQMKQFQEERLNGAARRLACTALIEETADYLRQRIAFGKPLLDNQFIQFKLAELKTEMEALRALVYLATQTYIQGGEVTELASMAKLKAGRLSREVADWCMQFQGGMGYTWDNHASRAYRDFRLGSIGGGADEVMLQVIAKQMGLMSRG
ncbi:Acyl-CoA dehydrogenase, C-terminal:Acyl-CoA dehydrogenase, central region:Acyl-CoA dehydrogenase, N-terminal [Cupriavidus taiwanensis]|uniref:Acyl-CoA dehydrogenase, C-terminal:Acyl-CoA dehydrogenase, central region:Acyl-CoA dehydrogenase, N-terminal n=1 Tax=Cupriavidus taiwanensis TaxID=164546 RepID=A0A375E7W5_9BURK|nr:acyl-CoA dehydrogenase family protein [Cupriavidus taiwanensis]SOZ60734.1 Acyl-CoA dehydrogenase, C-terminal:Acyl-CoA dehydrogenase, central region:Acyl-CoA dehydrogenase, N-terminal [Cupriavidus taiwanensis]SOZ60883.1 Acyl-CoA dehydrogenase, C-terminal:Acyl-CoA dehydrogenase, central region:Acyl-CoA dehydrogenase, N-terminal [Cupriavidus taiwanensis]SOZ64784.1 Acyl-CoA dehydrogenase, C-terminal:Acyl-CoA dehydrogenase, central region:Acyl-CoA dehydrogenase, N-terminal [Cupriavidus taiwanensis